LGIIQTTSSKNGDARSRLGNKKEGGGERCGNRQN